MSAASQSTPSSSSSLSSPSSVVTTQTGQQRRYGWYAIGAYSATLIAALLWRRWNRQRHHFTATKQLEAQTPTTTITTAELTPTTTTTTTTTMVVSSHSSLSVAPINIRPSLSGVTDDIQQSSPTSSPCSAPPFDSIASSTISNISDDSSSVRPSRSVNDIKSSRIPAGRTRVRRREDEVNDDDNKSWFLSATAAFTRQTISPLGIDNLEPLLRYESRGGYSEYIVGNLPIVISVPHGGYLRPLQIPERIGKDVCSTSDIFTQELGRAILQFFHERLNGRIPHMIINRLDRSRLDANRPVNEAAQHDDAARAFEWYQNAIEHAKRVSAPPSSSSTTPISTGLFIDLHGQSHDRNRIQVGYVVRGPVLRQSNVDLNNDVSNGRDASSIKSLASYWQSVTSTPSPASTSASSSSSTSRTPLHDGNGITFTDIIRGPQSLGALFESHGYGAVPSIIHNDAADKLYFNGGYNTKRHGSLTDTSGWQAIQLECNSIGVRDTRENRIKFAQTFVDVILKWLHIWYTPGFIPCPSSPSTSTTEKESPT